MSGMGAKPMELNDAIGDCLVLQINYVASANPRKGFHWSVLSQCIQRECCSHTAHIARFWNRGKC